MKQLFFVIVAIILMVSCKSKDSKTESSSTDTTTTRDEMAGSGYNFTKHDDITVFMDDLSKAASANDTEAITAMTNFPFEDQWANFKTGNTKDTATIPSLAARDAGEYLVNFNKLYVKELMDEIKGKKYRGYEKNENVPDIIGEGEYLILSGQMVNDRQYGLAIKKVDGKYKIYRTAFSS